MSTLVRALYVDLNSFFASCEQQLRPELRGRPIAVVPVLADTTFVIAASHEAKRFGVKTVMRVSEAKRKCPDLVLVTGRHRHYVEFHHKVIKAVDSVLPVTAVCSIDEIACELTGSHRKIDRARELALRVKAAIREQAGSELKCSIGLSMNFLLAKMACDMRKPDGLTVLAAGDLPNRLLPLKLQDVPGIGARMEKRLNEHGVFTMRDLLLKGEHETRGLWGSVIGSRYHRLLRGEWIDPRAEAPPKSVGHSHVLPPADRSYPGALAIAARLLSKAAVRMRKHRLMARKLGLTIKYLGSPEFSDDIDFHETHDTGALLRSLKEVYLRSPKDRKPLKVAVTLSTLVPAGEHQLSFFQNERGNDAYRAVDAINEKYGKDTVYTGALHGRLHRGETRVAFARIPELEELD